MGAPQWLHLSPSTDVQNQRHPYHHHHLSAHDEQRVPDSPFLLFAFSFWMSHNTRRRFLRSFQVVNAASNPVYVRLCLGSPPRWKHPPQVCCSDRGTWKFDRKLRECVAVLCSCWRDEIIHAASPPLSPLSFSFSLFAPESREKTVWES